MTAAVDPKWRDRAACLSLNPDMFALGPGGHPGPAVKVCGGCPVRLDCLVFTLGLPPSDRRGVVAGGWHFKKRGEVRPYPADVASGLADTYLEGAKN